MGILIVVLVLVLIAVGFGIRIVPQGYVFVIERLGKYHNTLGPGFHVIIPFIDRVSKRVSLKEQVADFPPQDVI
nr:peptidase [Pseudobutyrivibrio sp.]